MIGRIGISLALSVLLVATAAAQWAEYPMGAVDSRTLRNQSKAEDLYERGDFRRALFIYEKDLALLGDKYAQYMTGYMYLMGQGTKADPILASAWYRLAAERKAPEFVAVRDQLLATMNEEQRARSDALYLSLRKENSDLVIVMRLLLEDIESLQEETTGSRVSSGGSSSIMVIDPNTGSPVSIDQYQKRTRRNAQTRLDFVTARLDIDELDADLSRSEIDALWERINDYLAVVDDDGDVFVDSR